MSYSPLQPRGRDGKWVAKIGNSVVRSATKGSRGRKLSSRHRAQTGIGASMPGTDVKKKLDISRGNSAKRRGAGLAGLKKNAIPYVRANKRSQTVGVNAGTIIPGTGKRIVLGGYARIESTSKNTATDRAVSRVTAKALGKGTGRAKVVGSLAKKVKVSNPAVRANVGGAQVRLGTSRGAGPTVIVRRGSHKSPYAKTVKGVQAYDSRMSKIAGRKAKKPRPQRRGKK